VGVLTQLLSADQRWQPRQHSFPFPRKLSPLSNSGRVHVAAVCYRLRGDEPEFLLVRTRNGHWTFPKGGVDRDATTADAAAREAYEEAGVRGAVELIPFTAYRHCKPRKLRSRRHVVTVHAHLCEVKRLVPPLEGYRAPRWFRIDKAKRQLQKFRTPEFAAELSSVVDQAAKLIQHR